MIVCNANDGMKKDRLISVVVPISVFKIRVKKR